MTSNEVRYELSSVVSVRDGESVTATSV